jgi:hypothetical protein
MIGLALMAIGYGLVSVLLFRRLVNGPAVGQTVNRMLAHVMSFRLFGDEPALVFRAQRELFAENLRLLKHIALPLLASALLLAVSWRALDRWFGYRSVAVGEAAVLTLPLGSDVPSSREFSLETPPVRVIRLNQVSWRVRVLRESPQVTVRAQILGMPWMVWFLMVSTVTAIAAEASLRRSYR